MNCSKRLLTAFVVKAIQAMDLYEDQVQMLPYLNADPDTVTVSGHSYGGQYATHLLTVLSGTFKGAGNLKGAAFLAKSKHYKTKDTDYHVEKAVRAIRRLHEAGDIDDIGNLANNAVCIISG